jgi:hypothetical protein
LGFTTLDQKPQEDSGHARGILKPEASRFPPPWSVEETEACFIVREAQALAYVYCEPFRGEAFEP